MTHDMQYAAAAAGHSAPLYAEQVRVSSWLHCKVAACVALWPPACRQSWPSTWQLGTLQPAVLGGLASDFTTEFGCCAPFLWQLMRIMAAVELRGVHSSSVTGCTIGMQLERMKFDCATSVVVHPLSHKGTMEGS